jgi:hypothetical protein
MICNTAALLLLAGCGKASRKALEAAGALTIVIDVICKDGAVMD